jgi:hypothetical protein
MFQACPEASESREGVTAPAIRAHPPGNGGFLEGSRSQAEHRLRGWLFTSGESITIHFEEQNTNNNAGAFVSIDKRMIANDAR